MAKHAPYRRLVALAVAALAAWTQPARADELSADDHLRILYSNRFTFTERRLPLVTVEVMSGQARVSVGASDGVVVSTTGDGDPAIEAGTRWTVEVSQGRPARVLQWTVVERFEHDDERGAAAAEARWRSRGYEVKRFELGAVFGIEGEVIDSRELLVAIDPVAEGRGARRASAIARKHDIATSVHDELVRRPQGTLIARSDRGATVHHDSILWFAPKQPAAALEVKDVVHGGGGSQLDAERREDRRYWGQIFVTLDRTGALTVVNAVEADALLAGLVPSEIFPEAPEAALEAQAIAARTEVLSRIGTRHVADPYLLCSNQHCQVYAGAGREHPRTTRAVRDTRGLVLLRGGGGLVDARYSASCGGHSEHNETIWGGAPDPALRGSADAVDDGPLSRFTGVSDRTIVTFLETPAEAAYCGRTRYARGRFRWSVRVDAGELSRRVAAEYPNVGAVVALEPMERGISGRIKRLRIRGARGDAIAVGELHIRRLLGGLKSSLFVVSAIGQRDRPTAFVFDGAGFGHGVGMCQTGAIGRADAGQSFEQILRHYYPGSRTHRLY